MDNKLKKSGQRAVQYCFVDGLAVAIAFTHHTSPLPGEFNGR